MRILVHDYSGHPFQAQLSRELARRGHHVTHSFCEAHVSGKGRLHAEPGEDLAFDPVGRGRTVEKLRFLRRLLLELRFGLELLRQVRRLRPDVAIIANVPIPMLVVFAAGMTLLRVPWVLWQQDVQAVAVRSFAGHKIPRAFHRAAMALELGERWSARRAEWVVVIAESFLDVHLAWGTAAKTSVIPNWAPLDEIVPMPRANEWARSVGLESVKTLLYSGTLGLKHDPRLLVLTARRVIELGEPVHLVVVTEGPAVDVLRDEAEHLDVPLTVLPFQPYARLPEVLGSGDVLVVLLDRTAGSFSVPSKTLSYLCAGRPVLGLMPEANLAAQLLTEAGNCVLPPAVESVDAAAKWVVGILSDPARAATLGRSSRALAEREFALGACADRFEQVLERAVGT